MAALTVPMATDIAFAMAIFGFFRSTMPPSASVFLLTLATVDDLGAIFVRFVVVVVRPQLSRAAAAATAARRAAPRCENASQPPLAMHDPCPRSVAAFAPRRVTTAWSPSPRERSIPPRPQVLATCFAANVQAGRDLFSHASGMISVGRRR